MASIYRKKKSPFWYMSFIGTDGKPHDRSLKLRADVPAETRRARMLCAEQTTKELGTRAGGGTAFAQWLPDWIKAHYLNPATRTHALLTWRTLENYLRSLGITCPAQVTRQTCIGYLAWRTAPKGGREKAIRHNTALREIKQFAFFMREAELREYITKNPAARLGIGRVASKEKKPFTDEQIALIFRELAGRRGCEWMADAFRIALYQGVRLSETRVPLEDVRFDEDTIFFRKTKGNRPFATALHPELKPHLAARRDAGKAFACELPANASEKFNRFLKSIGLGDYCFHCARVTAITRMAVNGVDQRLAMAYVNHSSKLVHAVYTKLRPEHSMKVAAALHYGPSPAASSP